MDRFGEFVELLDRLLTSPSTTYDGTWFTARDARMHPGCVQQPRLPFVVAANGPRAMRVVARHGQAWVTTGGTPPEEGEQRWWAALPGAARTPRRRAGRRGPRARRRPALPERGLVRRVRPVLGRAPARRARAGAEALGFDEVVVHWPRPDGVYAGDVGVLEQAAAEVLPGLDPR